MELLSVLALSLLPAAGSVAGGLIAEAVPVSSRTLSLAFHGAAGTVLAVTGVEIMPRAIRIEPEWAFIAAFALGGLFFVLVDEVLAKISVLTSVPTAGGWLILFGVAVDLFTDGVMIGTGSGISAELAILLAVSQIPGDIPQGFATIASFKERAVHRKIRMIALFLLFVPIVAGAILGYLLFGRGSEFVKLLLLSFTAGTLVTTAVEKIIPEAHRGEEARLAALVFLSGFALFTLFSIYFNH